MKHYLVDTNVVIDMLLDREDADAACAVWSFFNEYCKADWGR